MSEGGDASRSTDVAVLKELIEQRFDALETQLDERRMSDQQAALATYATKENLKTLETLIEQRLKNIEGQLSAGSASRLAVRGLWTDLKGIVLLGFGVIAGVIGIITWLAQN